MSQTILGYVVTLDQTRDCFRLQDAIEHYFKRRFIAAGEPAGIGLFALIHTGDVHGLVVPKRAIVCLPDLFEAFSPWAVLHSLDRRVFTISWVAGHRHC